MLALLAGAAAAPASAKPAALEPKAEAQSFDKVFKVRTNAPERFGASEKLWKAFVNNGFLAKTQSARKDKTKQLMICDIGAADGSLTHFVAKAFDMNAHAYDIVVPEKNLYTVGKTMWPVKLYDGKHIPEPAGGCDITLFAYVLHHAADSTFKLLQEAARVTKHGTGHVLMCEDLADHKDAIRGARNLMHDPHGTFRTDGEWKAMLTAFGLELKESGRLFGDDAPQAFYISTPNATVATL